MPTMQQTRSSSRVGESVKQHARRLDNLLKHCSARIMPWSVLLVLVIAGVDHATGFEWSFSIFYLAPVALSSWYGRRRAGLYVSVFSGIVWLIVDHTSGHRYSLTIIPFWNASVRLGFFLITAYLLRSLREHLDVETRMARRDGLTGLLNLRAFTEAADLLFGLAARHKRPTVLAYMDLDNFKMVNDALGHEEGNEVLKLVATILKSVLRETDSICRMGGDEFVALMSETTGAEAVSILGRLRESLMNEAKSRNWPIGMSIGAVVFDGEQISVAQALKIADRLMYAVKASGKNACRVEHFVGVEGPPEG